MFSKTICRGVNKKWGQENQGEGGKRKSGSVAGASQVGEGWDWQGDQRGPLRSPIPRHGAVPSAGWQGDAGPGGVLRERVATPLRPGNRGRQSFGDVNVRARRIRSMKGPTRRKKRGRLGVNETSAVSQKEHATMGSSVTPWRFLCGTHPPTSLIAPPQTRVLFFRAGRTHC